MGDLGIFFKNYLNSNSIFKNKKSLQASYIPDTIMHREDETRNIASILAPALRTDLPSNVFIYGKTGTGKTLVMHHIAEHLNTTAKENTVPLRTLYINCKLKKSTDTEYRLLAELSRMLGEDVPTTGLPTSDIYDAFTRAIDKENGIVIIVLDEIDQLVKKIGDEILYSLTRLNSDLKKSQIAIVGISNDMTFADHLEPRVRSSLSEEDVVFPPYNAMQLQEILSTRVKEAFKDDVIKQGVIEKCAAFAARDHGDARRALDLLRVAGEICERNSAEELKIEHIDMAEKKIEKDRVLDIVKSQPKQSQAALYSILSVTDIDKFFFTGDIYETYKQVCQSTALRPLTMRRISDIIAELDTLGIINAQVMSKGRYGRTRKISLSLPPGVAPKLQDVLGESLGFR